MEFEGREWEGEMRGYRKVVDGVIGEFLKGV